MGSPLRIRREWIGQALGVADEGGPDETAVSTIDVRLDQIFRAMASREPQIALIHADELDKAREWRMTGWESKGMRSKVWEFELAEGFPAGVFEELNEAPAKLLSELVRQNRPVLCQSPQLWLERDQGKVRMFLTMRAIYLPVPAVQQEKPE